MLAAPPALALALVFAFAPAAGAHETDLAFDAALRRAQLVFAGEVLDVAYASSVPTGADGALPHTFVTFRIDKVLKGRAAAGDLLVLRFLGGEDPAAGEFVFARQPLFDVGDRDILMVEGNLRKACPLVHCAEGRFRRVRKLVFDEDGHEIVSHPQQLVAYGRQTRLQTVETHFVLGTVFRAVTAGEPGEDDLPLADAAPPMKERTFLDLVARRVKHLHTPAELAALEPVPSADPSQPFTVLPVQPVPFPPPPTAPPASEPPESFEDMLERLLLAANGGDPRLPGAAVRLLERVRALESRGSR